MRHHVGMKKSRWTVIVVPQGTSTSRVIEVSHTAVKLVGTLALAAVMVALLLGYGTIAKTLDMRRAREIAAENARLAEELTGLLGDRVRLADMAARARSMGRPDAAAALTGEVLALCATPTS